MLQDWLNHLAKMAATGEKEDFLACSASMGVPRIGEIISGYEISRGFSANITFSPLMSTGEMVVISPRLMVASSYSVSPEEVRSLAIAMANAGQKIYDDTSRMTGMYHNPQTISRLTVATEGGQVIFCGVRVTVPVAYKAVELVESRGTISPQLLELLVLTLMYSPGVVMAICGPGGTGKSTLLNALLFESVTRFANKMPSTVVFPGDAMDVVAPRAVPILPALTGNPAVVMLKSGNARNVFVGETVSEETREVLLASRGAFRSLATTVHGDIERASGFMPASVYVEMAVLGVRYVVWRVAVSISEVAPGLPETTEKEEMRLRTIDGEKRFAIVGGFDPIRGKFWHNEELLGQLVGYMKHIGETY